MYKLLCFFFIIILQGCSHAPRQYQYEPIIVVPDVVCPTPVIEEPRRPQLLIMIDPGHGGDDAGTCSTSLPRYQEKSLTLSTSKFLRDYLRQMGYRSLLTRSDDTFISLSKRADIANENATALFVSMHFNSAPSPEAHGIEVFYFQSDTDKSRTKSSKELAAMILDEVIQNTQAKSRGVKNGNFAVIRETKMPAILIEGGFLTNEAEMQKIKDPQYIKRIAWGIAKGVDHYVRTKAL